MAVACYGLACHGGTGFATIEPIKKMTMTTMLVMLIRTTTKIDHDDDGGRTRAVVIAAAAKDRRRAMSRVLGVWGFGRFHAIEPVTINSAVGDVVIFDKRLLHRGAAWMCAAPLLQCAHA